jgi:hypothetical protein
MARMVPVGIYGILLSALLLIPWLEGRLCRPADARLSLIASPFLRASALYFLRGDPRRQTENSGRREVNMAGMTYFFSVIAK